MAGVLAMCERLRALGFFIGFYSVLAWRIFMRCSDIFTCCSLALFRCSFETELSGIYFEDGHGH